MRRVALALAVAGLAAAAAGCGSKGTVAALPDTVVGTLPKAAPVSAGNAVQGKTLYASNGCGGCHTYAPAGSKGKIGPDLNRIPTDAQKANQGSIPQYTAASIKSPNSYVVPGYNPVMPSFASLGDQKIADLVAFVTQTKAGTVKP